MLNDRWRDDGSTMDTCPECGGRSTGCGNDGRCDRCSGVPGYEPSRLEILEARAELWRAAIRKTQFEINRQVYMRRLSELLEEAELLKKGVA